MRQIVRRVCRQVLMYLAAAKMHFLAGQHDEAMASAFRLGELVNEAGMKEVFEPDVDIGERVREGGRRAHVETYGTEKEIQARDATYAAAIKNSWRKEGADGGVPGRGKELRNERNDRPARRRETELHELIAHTSL